MGIYPEQIMRDNELNESNIRVKWMSIINNQMENISTFSLQSVFPAIYRKSKGMCY